MFTYVVEEGQRVLMRRPNGTMDVIVGPRRVWRGRNTFQPMPHFVAHPGDLPHRPLPRRPPGAPRRAGRGLVRPAGPPGGRPARRRCRLAAKEAVVVYSSKDGRRRRRSGGSCTARRCSCPGPGEWLHTFAWHGSDGGSQGVRKVAKGLVFQKLWLMPDQMYHDVPDVRTADDAVLTIRLMIFFELIDIDRMLEATHDPIGDFVNAATSDVVDFTGRHDFEAFKQEHRQAERAGDVPPAHRPRRRSAATGSTRWSTAATGRPDRLQADARPGDRGADQAPARPGDRAAGAGPGGLQARTASCSAPASGGPSRRPRSSTRWSWPA